jgi:hypothetical protein
MPRIAIEIGASSVERFLLDRLPDGFGELRGASLLSMTVRLRSSVG